MAKVLVVYHTQTGNTEKLALAVKEGVGSCGIDVILKKASEANLEDLLSSDGYCFGTPDYFSYMAGGLKDFFDRALYPVEGKVTDKPCFVFVTHGGGGKAVESVEEMCKRFKFKEIGKPLLIKGKPDSKAEKQLEEAGRKLATT